KDPFTFTKPEDFPAFEDLRRYSREYHDEVRAFLAAVSDARLEEPVTIQWFKDPPLTITVTEALTQCAMHSHYHRGQNATRLRELGGEPPMTDLIVWYWEGRPRPSWSACPGRRPVWLAGGAAAGGAEPGRSLNGPSRPGAAGWPPSRGWWR